MQAKIPGSVAEREEKLRKSLAEEATKKNEHDSKFRAVAQRMDYAGFHQMVLGANLKPTKAGEVFSIASEKGSVFNSACRLSNSSNRPNVSSSVLSQWRASSSSRPFILQSPGSFFEDLQKNPDFTVLAEILEILESFEDLGKIDEILEELTKISEFKGSKKLLSRKEKERLDELLAKVNKTKYLEFFI
jgi:hypothetical protein